MPAAYSAANLRSSQGQPGAFFSDWAVTAEKMIDFRGSLAIEIERIISLSVYEFQIASHSHRVQTNASVCERSHSTVDRSPHATV